MRWLRLGTKQFARNREAVAVLFDLHARSKACTVATLRAPASTYESFANCSMDDVRAAINYKAECDRNFSRGMTRPPLPPRTQYGFHAALRMLTLADLSTADMPNTPKERLAFRAKMNAMVVAYGNPTVFVTFNPFDETSLVLMRNGEEGVRYMNSPHDDEYDDDMLRARRLLPQRARRLQAIAENPVAQAEWFGRVLDVFLATVVGLDRESGRCLRGGGAFGEVYAYVGGVEGQARLSLHAHMLLWVVGMPETTSATLQLLKESEAFRGRVAKYMSAVMQSGYTVTKQLQCSSCEARLSALTAVDVSTLDGPSRPIAKNNSTKVEPATVRCTACGRGLIAGDIVLAAASSASPAAARLAALAPDEFLVRYADGTLHSWVVSSDSRSPTPLMESRSEDRHLPNATVPSPAVLAAYDTLVELEVVTHDWRHRATCFKVTKAGNGKARPSCRFNFPRASGEHQAVENDMLGTPVPRPVGSSWLNTFNPVVLKSFACNNDVRVLLRSEPGIVYYTACYAFKPQQKKAVDSALVFAALKARLAREQDQAQQRRESGGASSCADTAGGPAPIAVGRGRVLSSLYAMTSSLATGLPLAAFYMLRGSAYFASADFATLYIPAALDFLSGIPLDYGVSAQSGFRAAVPAVQDYALRGERLRHLSYYLVTALYMKTQRRAQANSEETGVLQDFVGRLLSSYAGFPNGARLPNCVRFVQEHPQHATHHLVLRRHASIVVLRGARVGDLSKLLTANGSRSQHEERDHINVQENNSDDRDDLVDNGSKTLGLDDDEGADTRAAPEDAGDASASSGDGAHCEEIDYSARVLLALFRPWRSDRVQEVRSVSGHRRDAVRELQNWMRCPEHEELGCVSLAKRIGSHMQEYYVGKKDAETMASQPEARDDSRDSGCYGDLEEVRQPSATGGGTENDLMSDIEEANEMAAQADFDAQAVVAQMQEELMRFIRSTTATYRPCRAGASWAARLLADAARDKLWIDALASRADADAGSNEVIWSRSTATVNTVCCEQLAASMTRR